MKKEVQQFPPTKDYALGENVIRRYECCLEIKLIRNCLMAHFTFRFPKAIIEILTSNSNQC